MTYAEYLRKVRKAAMRAPCPWLCLVNTVAGRLHPGHSARLRRTIDRVLDQSPWEYSLPTVLRHTRPAWAARLGDNAKHIRISWLTEQIKLADAEASRN